MNKMVVNHLDKLFVTSDAATIIRELDVDWLLRFADFFKVQHPAAKLIIFASQMQETEVLILIFLIFRSVMAQTLSLFLLQNCWRRQKTC
jgi:hypothetical protein